MNNQKQVQITEEGLLTLQNELKELEEVKRPSLVARLSDARADGDLSENSDYQNGKADLELLDGRITELKSILKNSVVVQSNGDKPTSVDLGTKVTLKLNSNQVVYHLVGENEANPVEKKISVTSPLGQALSGKKVGDVIEVEAPVGMITYQILAIE